MQEAHLRPGNAVQIIGKVNPDLSVRVFSALDLGAGVGKFQHPTFGMRFVMIVAWFFDLKYQSLTLVSQTSESVRMS